MKSRIVCLAMAMLVVMTATASFATDLNSLVFVAMIPCRVVDTRAFYGFPGAFGAPSLVGGATRTFPIQSNTTCPIPAVAQAYSFNITVVPPGPLGYITAYPTGQNLPLAATVNSPQGFIVGNAAIVLGGTNGSINIYATNPTDIVIDINGYFAPVAGSTATGNTSLGLGVLQSNTTGNSNTAVGFAAMQNNTTGLGNTAVGYQALVGNVAGQGNTATGTAALGSNQTGNFNNAVGSGALAFNTFGNYNNAFGTSALTHNTEGSFNTAVGESALKANTTGISNVAIGRASLSSNTTGSNNVAIGENAGNSLTTGSNNVHIANTGTGNDNGSIRIGTTGTHFSFFVAGVRAVTTTNNDAIPVVIDSNGQLGTVNSSRRFKQDIEDMGEASRNLMRLRPVTYRYQKPFADGSKPIQYGLIAEEVADVYPDLVAHSADGQIETVKYQVLDSMLLNEVQHQQAKIGAQETQIRDLKHQIMDQDERLRKMEAALASISGLPRAQ